MTQRLRGRVLAPAAAAVGALLLTSCGDAGSPEKASPEPSPTPSVEVKLRTPLLQRPIDRARLLPSELAAIGRAELITRAACMRRYGFEYRVDFTRSLHATIPDRSYGVMSKEQASRYGYHMAPDVDPRVPANQEKQTDLVGAVKARTAEDRKVEHLLLYGSESETITEADIRRGDGAQPAPEAKVIGEYKDRPVREGGCYEEARTTVVGDGGSERNPVAMGIYLRSFDEAGKDPEVREVVKKWSSCMARKGYKYDSPLDAGNDLPTAKSPEPDAREKKVALADIACKNDTSLIRVWSTVEARYEQRAMAKEKKAITAETKRKQGMVRRALDILGSTEGAAR
ncbi:MULTISPECIES: hypothetical protein [unclassified Streptomyces]|uniref:hypothetical protein n=1 Tax=unclassified Streptomyces TaxID=2593676 RepID=UPI00364E1B1D